MISLYAKAWWHLIRFDILLLTRSFGVFYQKVRIYSLHAAASFDPDADQIVTAFQITCVWYPRFARCLQRSAALTCLLRSYGIPAYMVIGTQKRPFKAHAWVEANGRVLNDKEYTPEIYDVLDRC
jgi:hypothetical protein